MSMSYLDFGRFFITLAFLAAGAVWMGRKPTPENCARCGKPVTSVMITTNPLAHVICPR